MRSKLSVLIIIIFLLGCKHSIENKIANKIESTFKGKSCSIDIRDITDFDWDKMYVFNYTATSEEVKSIIGSAPSAFTELTRRIIFTWKNKIIYSEENETAVEGVVNKQVVFDMPNTKNFKLYSIDSSKFIAYRKDSEGTLYYELVQQ